MNTTSQQDAQAILFPEIHGNTSTAEAITLELRIPEGLSYFAGHFEQIAVVPGVVQIQWAVHYARQYLGLSQKFSHMEAIKFKELLLPGQHLRLSLRFEEAACKLTFCYSSEACEYSSGRIYFHAHAV